MAMRFSGFIHAGVLSIFFGPDFSVCTKMDCHKSDNNTLLSFLAYFPDLLSVFLSSETHSMKIWQKTTICQTGTA